MDKLNKGSGSDACPESVSVGSAYKHSIFIEGCPPKLNRTGKVIRFLAWVLIILPLIYFAAILCDVPYTCIHEYCMYVFLLALFIGLISRWVVSKDLDQYRARLEDPSEMEALFSEVDGLERRVDSDGQERPESFDQKVEYVEKERDKIKKLGEGRWTEYQVLPLQQMLVEFYRTEDLISSARSVLLELGEYAEDNLIRYDREVFSKQERRIEEAIDLVRDEERDEDEKEKPDPVRLDDKAERLRAEYRSVLDHIASYQRFWSEGSSLMRGLISLGVCVLPVLLALGLVPVFSPGAIGVLQIYNWGFMGSAGAVSAMLLDFRNSNLVEVGNHEGKRELMRAITGSILGFLAGILVFALICGGFLEGGSIVPNLNNCSLEQANTTPMMLKDICLSVVWAVSAGFSFDKVFNKVSSVTDVN